jgi:hypothetical protein
MIGQHSRSPSGCGSIPLTRRCGSHTNRFTVTCTYRHGTCSMPACFTVCAVAVRYGDRGASGSPTGRGQIRNTVSIRERPAEADDPEVPGHWEGDLVYGMRPSAVATLVDRATRYAIVVALPDGHKADAVARADRPDGSAAGAPAAVVDMGPRPRDGTPRRDYRSAVNAGVLLRPAPSLPRAPPRNRRDRSTPWPPPG